MMDVLGMELTGSTGPDQMLRIVKGRMPEEVVPHRLPGQRPRSDVVRAQPPVDVGQQFHSFFLWDALEQHPICPSSMKLSINKDIHLGLPGDALDVPIVGW